MSEVDDEREGDEDDVGEGDAGEGVKVEQARGPEGTLLGAFARDPNLPFVQAGWGQPLAQSILAEAAATPTSAGDFPVEAIPGSATLSQNLSSEGVPTVIGGSAVSTSVEAAAVEQMPALPIVPVGATPLPQPSYLASPVVEEPAATKPWEPSPGERQPLMTVPIRPKAVPPTLPSEMRPPGSPAGAELADAVQAVIARPKDPEAAKRTKLALTPDRVIRSQGKTAGYLAFGTVAILVTAISAAAIHQSCKSSDAPSVTTPFDAGVDAPDASFVATPVDPTFPVVSATPLQRPLGSSTSTVRTKAPSLRPPKPTATPTVDPVPVVPAPTSTSTRIGF